MPNSKLRLAALALTTSLIGGCATGSSSNQCPPIAEYSRAFQIQMADELKAYVPTGAALREAMKDYQNLRDQLRACR